MFANILGCQALLLLFVLLISCFFLTNGRYRYLYILYKTWRRDLRGLSKVFPAMYRIAKCEKNQETIPKLFTKIAKSRPHKVAFYFEDETWTFGQIEDYSNKIANYFISLGYEKGDTVALLLENRPEYAAIWIGLSKIGVVTALINTNLVSKPLQHCISVAKVRALIFGSDFASAVKEIYPESGEIKLYHFKTSPSAESRNGVLDIKECISNQSVASPQKHMDMSNTKDKLLYIYTSGTTGLPKAAKITHARFNFAVTGINYFLSLGENDNFYNPLPLYHATGGMLTVGQTLIFGVTMTLRRKFSASHFWTDCNKYNCTVANYIGETCRYILAAHKGKPTIAHGVKKMFGNGLKKDVWKDFVETFNIPELFEFYGSTEGNTNLINLDNTIGSVGFLPFYLGPIFSICLIKCDDETKEPLRDANGLCIRCKDNEPGILIGKIYKKISTHNFDGYVDQKETNKKILQDVFQKGDSYFNSGDMMVQDEFGYLYFRDRTGDTYRWKGENVATTEVELVVSDVIGPKDIVVYGVEIAVASFVLALIWIFARGRRYRLFYIIYKTWRREVLGMWRGAKTILTVLIRENRKITIPKLFQKTVRRKGNKIAFYFENEQWTFNKVDEYSNKVANYFLCLGYKKGDSVALLLENRPEYAAIWLGLAKIGVITALININLVSKSLLHCISIVNAKSIIFGSDFVNAITDIESELGATMLLQLNTSPVEIMRNALDFQKCISECPTTVALRSGDMSDTILYIFTSGTTGLPKAAKITNSKYSFSAAGIYNMVGITEDDIYYSPLPLYHATAGMMSLGLCILYGVPLALRKKFSASAFWNDCIKYNCTVTNYIGETCRYILAAHRGQTNIQHKVRKMWGNGLKRNVWKEFVETFHISNIYEGYGSTEGNVNIINVDGTLGAVGFIPLIISKFSPLRIVKYNEEHNEPIRDENGFCIECKDGEPGLMVGRIHKALALSKFEGYVDQKETTKKLFRNVFKKGDMYFNTGDLMVKDEFNYLYFSDRIGDTFRWKGENVATAEVEYIASEILGPVDLVVYGVEVPNTEGKAGMLAAVGKENLMDTKKLATGFKSHLPTYAIPLFVRLLEKMPLTSTFKVQKTVLQKQGFDINSIKDPLFIFDSKTVDYVPLVNVYDDVISGNRKL
ncbi:long-chain fatty acid transport protein 4 [Diabrotica virgifera virgifera]|uniref:Long-chain-fatty-acid--CoA ligase n=1 Tax=Diabrotica virgifera virgifera TaxID=50390 RepID=A0ABM5KIT8_DIAVI|nr:long-chain fatty acid transport protein 4 [Diabrotica virgifera virgifera]